MRDEVSETENDPLTVVELSGGMVPSVGEFLINAWAISVQTLKNTRDAGCLPQPSAFLLLGHRCLFFLLLSPRCAFSKGECCWLAYPPTPV